jgi:hypothetical protein
MKFLTTLNSTEKGTLYVWEDDKGILEQNKKNGNYLLFCKQECIMSYFKNVSEMH